MANLPDVDCRYGAPMGRGQSNLAPLERSIPLKFRLSRVYVNSGGYDRGGAYWGTGAPIYQAYVEELPEGLTGQYGRDWIEFYFRESGGREAAKERVRAQYPNARFYR